MTDLTRRGFLRTVASLGAGLVLAHPLARAVMRQAAMTGEYVGQDFVFYEPMELYGRIVLRDCNVIAKHSGPVFKLRTSNADIDPVGSVIRRDALEIPGESYWLHVSPKPGEILCNAHINCDVTYVRGWGAEPWPRLEA